MLEAITVLRRGAGRGRSVGGAIVQACAVGGGRLTQYGRTGRRRRVVDVVRSRGGVRAYGPKVWRFPAAAMHNTHTRTNISFVHSAYMARGSSATTTTTTVAPKYIFS